MIPIAQDEMGEEQIRLLLPNIISKDFEQLPKIPIGSPNAVVIASREKESPGTVVHTSDSLHGLF